MGDTGTIAADGFKLTITDTLKKADGLHVHYAKVVTKER